MRSECLLLLCASFCLGRCWSEPLPAGRGSSSSEPSRLQPLQRPTLRPYSQQHHGQRSPSGSPRSPMPSSKTLSSASSARSSPLSSFLGPPLGSRAGQRSPSLPAHPAHPRTSSPRTPPRTPPPCDCDCYKRPTKLLCAMDPRSRDKETFLNDCQVDCYNCTMKKRYKVVAHVPCEQYKD